MKLSKTQQELYEAIKSGTKVYYMSGINAYFFRADTSKTILPSTAKVIESLPNIHRVEDDWRGYCLVYKSNDNE